MLERRLPVVNPLGLHARAAARFVQTASRFTCHIRVRRGARTMDGKSILGLLLLAASRGTTMDIMCEGVDEAAAMESLAALVERGFEEQ